MKPLTACQNIVRKRLADGTVKTYIYDRRSPQRIALDKAREHLMHLYKVQIGKMLANARSRAKKRGLGVSVTADQVLSMLQRQNYTYAVSGLPFDMGRHTGAAKRPFTPSLDRIDNRCGYVDGNLRVVCTMVNFAMGEWGEEALFKIADSMVRTRRKQSRQSAN